MNNYPLVSILMTVYNREIFLVEAIESVLNIDYLNWELIIVDDCSSDNSWNIASKYAGCNDRIKLYKNQSNVGDYPNRNSAASYASGKYIVFVDSDDRIFPNSLVSWVSKMEKYNGNFGIFNHYFVDGTDELDSFDVVRCHFLIHPVLNYGPIATIYNRNFFWSIGGFSIKYGPANDSYTNLKASSKTNKTIVFSTPLVNYRLHDGQELNNKYSYIYNNYLYFQDCLKDLDLPLSTRELVFFEKKNKRRFFVNIVIYTTRTLNFKKAKLAVDRAKFRWIDVYTAIFQR